MAWLKHLNKGMLVLIDLELPALPYIALITAISQLPALPYIALITAISQLPALPYIALITAISQLPALPYIALITAISQLPEYWLYYVHEIVRWLCGKVICHF